MAKSVKELERAVAQLPKEQLRKFRAWYEKFDADAWDQQIEEDAKAGRLDGLAEAALTDHEAGKSKKF